MCQLLGISSNNEVDMQLSLQEFRHSGRNNPHGWGFAFTKNEKWNVVKEPLNLENEDSNSKKFKSKSKIIIGHIRWGNCGTPCHQNTHPFSIDTWAFAHNGTVRSMITDAQFLLKQHVPKGQTDSEYAFCYLLEKIGAERNTEKIKEILKIESNNIKKHGNFNFLLSNNKVLFAFGDNKLYFVQRKEPFQEITLKEENCTIHLNNIKKYDEKAIIIATEPLTKEEKWEKIIGLKTFKDGEEV